MNSRSPRTTRRPAADIRAQLVEAGLRLIEEGGPEALQTRRVVAEVGASTMAVYTHFGGMTGLLEALAAESFSQFGAALAAAPITDDPVADFLVMGNGYRGYALASPQRYRLMFGLTAPQIAASRAMDFTTDAIAADTFEQLVSAVDRMVTAGHLRTDPVRDIAARLWALIHGVVTLELAGYLGTEDRALPAILGPATIDLLVGMGADRAHLEQSVQRATRHIGGQAG